MPHSYSHGPRTINRHRHSQHILARLAQERCAFCISARATGASWLSGDGADRSVACKLSLMPVLFRMEALPQVWWVPEIDANGQDPHDSIRSRGQHNPPWTIGHGQVDAAQIRAAAFHGSCQGSQAKESGSASQRWGTMRWWPGQMREYARTWLFLSRLMHPINI